MDQNQHGKHQHATGKTSTSPTQTHAINQYHQPNYMMMAPPLNHPPTQFAAPSSVPSPYLRDQQYAHHHIHQPQQEDELQPKLNNFWENQYREIDVADFRNHSLPLARIKKIMKTDEEVKMISAEAPVIFAKACEMFIMELTMRAWANAEENKRRTLQKNDIAAAVTKTEVFDFLVDVVPRDETMDLDLYSGIRSRSGSGIDVNANVPCQNVPYCYYYMPPQHVVGPPPCGLPPRVVMGGAASVADQSYYGPQAHPFAAQVCPKLAEHSSDSDD